MTNKAAITGMTRQLAMEGSEHGIRVNSISPGFIESNSTRGELEDDAFGRDMRARTLLGRFGQPEDVANAVVWLSSDRAAQVTGVVLPIDGGTTAGPPYAQTKLIMSTLRPPESGSTSPS